MYVCGFKLWKIILEHLSVDLYLVLKMRLKWKVFYGLVLFYAIFTVALFQTNRQSGYAD